MKFGKKFLRVLQGIAPTAVAALAGPYAPLALAVMKKVVGKEGATQHEVEDAVLQMAGNPESIVKLRELETAMQMQERELGLRFEEHRLRDVQDARRLARETTVWPQVVLSALFITGYFVLLGLFFSDRLATPESEAFTVLIGVLGAAIPQVLQFWFGSSQGSKEKTQIIANG